MKTIETSLTLDIPDGVNVTVKSRIVTVKGERGTLTRSFKHQNFDMSIKGKTTKQLVLTVYFATRKDLAALRTVHTHVSGALPPTALVMFRMEARHRMGGASGQYI
jgi:large subunit ribosomal protein L9e